MITEDQIPVHQADLMCESVITLMTLDQQVHQKMKEYVFAQTSKFSTLI